MQPALGSNALASRSGLAASPLAWFALTLAILVVWVGWAAFDYPMAAFRFESDYWEHTAALAEWKSNLWHPANPHVVSDAGSPRYMPLYFVLTALAIAFDLDPFQTMAIAATINTALLGIGVYLFFRHYFRSDAAPLVGLLTLLGAWGLGWIFSNLFQLRGLFFVAGYPSMFVFATGFIAWWQTTRIIRGEVGGWVHFGALALLCGLMFTSHPLTGVFGIGTAGLIALLEPRVRWTTRALVLVSLALGTALSEAWPYFSAIQVTLGTSGGAGETWVSAGALDASARATVLDHAFYDPRQVLLTLGPALLGLPAMILLLRRGEHLFIVAGFAGATALYVANIFVHIPLGHRFLLFAAVYLQLALAWWIIWSAAPVPPSAPVPGPRMRSRTAVLLVLALGISVIWNTAIAALQFVGFQATPRDGLLPRYSFLQPIPKDLGALVADLPDDAVVIGHPAVLWPLPTFKGKVVAAHHSNPMVPDDSERRSDAIAFTTPGTPAAERRGIIEKYRATHILYNGWHRNVGPELNELGAPVTQHKSYVLLRVPDRQP